MGAQRCRSLLDEDLRGGVDESAEQYQEQRLHLVLRASRGGLQFRSLQLFRIANRYCAWFDKVPGLIAYRHKAGTRRAKFYGVLVRALPADTTRRACGPRRPA